MSMIGICGDNCLFCPRYIVTQKGSAKDLENVKELWVKLGLRDRSFPAREMACHGCKPENKCAYSEIRACAAKRHVESCGLCDGYPCGLIDRAFAISEKLCSHATLVCTPMEIETLKKAYFSKKQNLDQMHLKKKKEMEKQSTQQ